VRDGTRRFYALQGRKQHISGSAASARECAYFHSSGGSVPGVRRLRRRDPAIFLIQAQYLLRISAE